MKLTTDFIRAAVEGKTADGREITAQQIQQMAESYSQDVYNARVWTEHLRGTLPDGLFKALGDVVEVKAESIKGGALNGKMALYVKLEPHPDLVTMVRSGQKVHLSIEMHPNMPNTNGAYLMGLGVTDSPASLGTGIMKFSTSERAESIFSDPAECAINEPPKLMTGENQPEHFKQMFDYFTKEINSIRAERDAWKAQYTDMLAAKDAEIDELNKQIPADGYKVPPKFTGRESDGKDGSFNGWR